MAYKTNVQNRSSVSMLIVPEDSGIDGMKPARRGCTKFLVLTVHENCRVVLSICEPSQVLHIKRVLNRTQVETQIFVRLFSITYNRSCQAGPGHLPQDIVRSEDIGVALGTYVEQEVLF